MGEQIPAFPVTFRDIQIDTRGLREQLLTIPRSIIAKVQKRVAQSLESDAQSLISDLMKAFEILSIEPNSLNIYVEQTTTLKVLKETMETLSSRYEQIRRLSKLCDSIAIGKGVVDKVQEGEVLIKQLP